MAGPKVLVPAGLTLNEARRISKRFSVRMAQSNGDMNVYWLPQRRDIVCRSAFSTNVPPPDAAVVVGCYRPPHPARLFLQDLSATVTA